ncbi:hypothetical protein AAVH_37180, partial [Aphelenchoides avenae]
LSDHFKQKFGVSKTYIYNCRKITGSSSWSLHAEGRAVDVVISGAKGRQAFDYAVSIACKTGIQEVIFSRRIWTNRGGERAYNGVNPHTDHVHIGLNRCGATKWGA